MLQASRGRRRKVGRYPSAAEGAKSGGLRRADGEGVAGHLAIPPDHAPMEAACKMRRSNCTTGGVTSCAMPRMRPA